MEIDNYRNFLAIVEAGSMTSASEFVHIAQPALSKQLKSLEGYFGTKLIITTRGSKHLILTDAGKILYHKAKYICSLEDMARIEIDDISDGNRGTLRISAANSRSSIFIKTCLEPFHDLFPNVVYEIYEGSVNEQSQQLLSGITELGILSVPLIHQNDFEILFQREEDICAIFSKNSAGRRLISLLSPKQNLILFTKGKNPIYIYGNKDYLPQAAGTAGYSHPHRQCQKR